MLKYLCAAEEEEEEELALESLLELLAFMPVPAEAELVDVERDNEGECNDFVDSDAEEESFVFCLLLGDEVGDAKAPDAAALKFC